METTAINRSSYTTNSSANNRSTTKAWKNGHTTNNKENRDEKDDHDDIKSDGRTSVAYNWNASTGHNYRADAVEFHGKYAAIRQQLDYSYHTPFIKERQLLQDSIIDSLLQKVEESVNCSRPTTAGNHQDSNSTAPSPPHRRRPWIVFTAGVMGAGKSHTIRLLANKGRFPLQSFVVVDPDTIRQELPEYSLYQRYNPAKAGVLTNKEAGMMVEILTAAALQQGLNVLVDGSLRDASWYQLYFEQLRAKYPTVRIAILHVTAPPEAIFERAASRALDTGRMVPQELLELSMEQVPRSVAILRHYVDFFVELHNARMDDVDLVTNGVTWETFRRQWVQATSCAL